jgi:S-adenosylmethionine synthetase
MSRPTYHFTSESVSEGHPDKVADRISDEIVDLYFRSSVKGGMDPADVRVAAETLTTTNKVIIAGETRGLGVTNEEIEAITRSAIKDIGYEQPGFHYENVDIQILLHAQSVDIADGVDLGKGTHKSEGAGDQGIMFGYASNEVREALMPAPIYYSHRILQSLSEARHSGAIEGLEPDAKSQVSVRYENGVPAGISSIVLSTQHKDGLSALDVEGIVKPYIYDVIPDGWLNENTIWHINPTGNFVIGGPDGDAGLTGRKIIVDTYGGMAPHGGGAFSGKDPTKVDRSAAYAARYLAKNIVATGLSDWANIQISYAIGVSNPTSLYIDLGEKNSLLAEKLEMVLPKLMDLTPRGIRDHLGLNKAIYARTAAYGHFGRNPDLDGGFSWEKIDLVKKIKASI